MSEKQAGKEKKPISVNRAWTYVAIGGALEIVWASGFKYEEIPPIIVLAALITSFDLIIRAAKVIPVGTTYAVFTGIGTVGLVAVELATGDEPFRLGRVALVLLLLAFLIGLKLTGGRGET